MANLETLEIRVAANAESAAQGLSHLIGSLSALSKGVGKAVGGLQRLNTELGKIKGFSGMKLPGMLGEMSGTSSRANRAVRNIKQVNSALQEHINTVTGINRVSKSGRESAIWMDRLMSKNELGARAQKAAKEARATVMNEFRGVSDSMWQSWRYGPRLLPNIVNNVGTHESEETLRQRNPQWYQDPVKQAIEAQKELREGTGSAEWARDLARNTAEVDRFGEAWEQVPAKIKKSMTSGEKLQFMKNIKKEVADAGKAFEESTKPAQQFSNAVNEAVDGESAGGESTESKFTKFKNAVASVKDAIPPLNKAGGALGKFASQVGRIMKTMLIRNALRAVISGAKEGLDNFYNYSKQIGSKYASVLDTMSMNAGTAKNQLGAALGTALAAVIPILNALASAALTALNALSQLFALLSGSSTWTKATTAAEGFNEAVGGGGGGGIKELLADFDELNVIASEGGGGGGGGAALDYLNMFEEMTEFDSRIKDLVTWLEDHIPIVNAAIAGMAAALAGLGGAGITISIGLALAFSGGYDMGKNGVNATNLLETIGGIVATAVGGAWLGAGTVVGAGLGGVIGLTLGLLVTVAGIYIGSMDSLYGDIHQEMAEIKKNVRKYFAISDVELSIYNVRIDNIREAEKAVSDALNSMNINYQLVISKMDSMKNIKALLDSVNSVVDAARNLIALRKEQIQVGLELTTQFDNPEEVIKFSDEQWGVLDAYVAGLGEQIGKILSDGVISGVDEQNMLSELQDKLNRVTTAILTGEQSGKFVGNLSLAGSDFRKGLQNGEYDRSTFTNYLKAYREQYNELEKVAEANAIETKTALSSLYYGMVESGQFSQEELDRAKANMDQFDVAKDVADKMKVWTSEGTKMFAEDIQSGLGTVLSEELASNLFKNEIFSRTFKENLESAAKTNNWDDVGRIMQTKLQSALSEATGIDQKLLVDIQNILGVTGWDMLTNDLKTQYFNTLQGSLGETNAMIMLNRTFGVTASEILPISGWDTFSNTQKLNFLSSMTEAFGGAEVLNAAKGAGIDVIKEIENGLNSGDGGERAAAKKLMDSLQSELDAQGLNVNVGIDATVTVSAVGVDGVEIRGSSGFGVTGTRNASQNSRMNLMKASGAYDIPRGDVFIANEAGAELIGSINGKTSVANQGQIIEGIAGGVERANAEQNQLLREQNSLLRELLTKENTVRIGASASLGRTVKQSLDMYSRVGG